MGVLIIVLGKLCYLDGIIPSKKINRKKRWKRAGERWAKYYFGKKSKKKKKSQKKKNNNNKQTNKY